MHAISESVKRFAILERDFEIDRDEVTPTLKLRREVITKRFAGILQGLYSEASSPWNPGHG
jgi:long-chain acyl-CoA synthetase